MIEDAIQKRLAGRKAISDLAGGRVFPSMARQSPDLPYLSYLRVGGEPLESLSGSSGESRALIEVTCWAEKYRTAKELAEEVRLALQGFKGRVGTDKINAILLTDDGRDVPQEPEAGEGRAIFGVQQDFAVWFDQPKPVFS